jgi:hypothetical protein
VPDAPSPGHVCRRLRRHPGTLAHGQPPPGPALVLRWFPPPLTLTLAMFRPLPLRTGRRQHVHFRRRSWCRLPQPLACGLGRAARAMRRPVKRAQPKSIDSTIASSVGVPSEPQQSSNEFVPRAMQSPQPRFATPCLLLIGCRAMHSLGTNITSPATFASPKSAHLSVSAFSAQQAANSNHVRDSAWMRDCPRVAHSANGGVSN